MARPQYKGKKYGSLTLLEKSRSGGAGIGVLWRALCDCGTVAEVRFRRVLRGDVTSCGKCQFRLGGRKKPGRQPVMTTGVPEGHIDHFRRILRVTNITAQQYLQCISNQCVICGTTRVHAELTSPAEHSLVAICKPCSVLRNGTNPTKWLTAIIRLVNLLQSRLNR